MKVFKWILYALLVIAGMILVIPVFLPSSVSVNSHIDIAISPELIFQNAALYTDRDQWDPWLTMEPDAKVTIIPNPNYVGSIYKWDGEKIGSGKMRIDSVSRPNYIKSSIYFRESPDASTVEWILDEKNGGSSVSWRFTSKGAYPFGRLMLLFMKGSLQTAFDTGLSNYKTYLEENPPKLYKQREIRILENEPTNAMVLPVEGTMEEIGQAMMTGFPKLFEEISKQGLKVNGPPFAHYIDYDENTGYSHALLAIPVNEKGIASGHFKPKFYNNARAVSVMHFGKYDYFKESYDALGSYVKENNLEVTGEAFEIYLKSMAESINPMEWQTLVAFTLKD